MTLPEQTSCPRKLGAAWKFPTKYVAVPAKPPHLTKQEKKQTKLLRCLLHPALMNCHRGGQVIL